MVRNVGPSDIRRTVNIDLSLQRDLHPVRREDALHGTAPDEGLSEACRGWVECRWRVWWRESGGWIDGGGGEFWELMLEDKKRVDGRQIIVSHAQ